MDSFLNPQTSTLEAPTNAFTEPLCPSPPPPPWPGRLDAPGQRRRHLPSCAWTRRKEVKQGKSGGSVGTTDRGKGKGRTVVRPMGTAAYGGKGQGKGKGRGEGRLGQGGRGRSKGGEKPMGTTAYGGKGSKGRAANGDRPVGAASCRRDHHTMASCQTPPPPYHGPSQAGSSRHPPWAPPGVRGAACEGQSHHCLTKCTPPPPAAPMLAQQVEQDDDEGERVPRRCPAQVTSPNPRVAIPEGP